jgi:hypothetical protein
LATQRNLKGGILISRSRTEAKVLLARIVFLLGENFFRRRPDGKLAPVVLIRCAKLSTTSRVAHFYFRNLAASLAVAPSWTIAISAGTMPACGE